METNGNMGRFFDWLAKPMDKEDINAWYLANNITPELTELVRDFCFSFLNLLKDTYLGDDFRESMITFDYGRMNNTSFELYMLKLAN